jgi:hypothetical protein
LHAVLACHTAGNVPFDLVQGDDPLTAERLLEVAAQKEKQWQKLLSDVSVSTVFNHCQKRRKPC